MFYVDFIAYSGLWILDAAQLREFMTEPGGYFYSGPTDWGLRERMAFGYNFGRTPQGILRNRLLVPLDPKDWELDSDFGVHHLSDKYTNNPQGSPRPNVVDVAKWDEPIEAHFVPLSQHPSHPCALG